MNEGPFRDSTALLLCPRCGDLLLAVFDGVHSCPRCRGTWIPQPIVERAFGPGRWPVGANAWWRRELRCPECIAVGITEMMRSVAVGELIADRCNGHGVWLDEGELSRLAGMPARPDLAVLYGRLVPDGPLPDLDTWRESVDEQQRAARLARWRAQQAMVEAEQRARLKAAEEAARLEQEQAARAAEDAARAAQDAIAARERWEREELERIALVLAEQRRAHQAVIDSQVLLIETLEREREQHRAAVNKIEVDLYAARVRLQTLRDEVPE